ncbi:hypothetical protein LTR94_032840, partial [Friedmanniomyces endolithicus]
GIVVISDKGGAISLSTGDAALVIDRASGLVRSYSKGGRMLAQAEANGHLRDPMALLGILLLPQLDLKDEAGAHPYAHFLLHFATQYWSLTSSLFAAVEGRAQNLFRVIGHLRALMEGVHPDVARNRILLCNMMLQSLLVRWDHMPPEDRTVPLEAH